jgi:hypothetical protein
LHSYTHLVKRAGAVTTSAVFDFIAVEEQYLSLTEETGVTAYGTLV